MRGNETGLVIDGHVGTWYVLDSTLIKGERYHLLEHETFGDSAACIIANELGEMVIDDVWNGFDDLVDFIGG